MCLLFWIEDDVDSSSGAVLGAVRLLSSPQIVAPQQPAWRKRPIKKRGCAGRWRLLAEMKTPAVPDSVPSTCGLTAREPKGAFRGLDFSLPRPGLALNGP